MLRIKFLLLIYYQLHEPLLYLIFDHGRNNFYLLPSENLFLYMDCLLKLISYSQLEFRFFRVFSNIVTLSSGVSAHFWIRFFNCFFFLTVISWLNRIWRAGWCSCEEMVTAKVLLKPFLKSLCAHSIDLLPRHVIGW